MTDIQPTELKEYEKVLQEVLYSEKSFLDRMGFLASLAPTIRDAIARKQVNQNPTPEMAAHQVAMLEFLDAAVELNKNADAVLKFFKQATELAKKIENGSASEQEIVEHQKMQAVIKPHMDNILKMAELSAKYDVVKYFDPDATKLPLNDFIAQKMREANRAGKLPTLAADAFQRLPRYKILTEELIKQLGKENLVGTIQPDILLMSLETAEESAEKSNTIVNAAQLEKRIRALKIIIQDKNKKPSDQQIAVAVSQLKELISSGENINTLLQQKSVDLGDVVKGLNQAQKIRNITLSSPSQKQIGEVGAQVLSSYISGGFRINFDESIKASQLWKAALSPETTGAKPKPVVIDLPKSLLKNSAQVRRAVKTANELKALGFEVETTPAFKKAVDKYQKKSYGFFNFRAKSRQSAFKKQGDAFTSGVKIHTQVAQQKIPNAQERINVLQVENKIKEDKKADKKEGTNFVLRDNKKELSFLEKVTQFTQLDDALTSQYEAMMKSPSASETELRSLGGYINKHLDSVGALASEAMKRNDDVSNTIFEDLMLRSSDSRDRVKSIESQIVKLTEPENRSKPSVQEGADHALPTHIQQEIDSLNAEYEESKDKLLKAQEIEDLLAEIEAKGKEIQMLIVKSEKEVPELSRDKHVLEDDIDREIEKIEKEYKLLLEEFNKDEPNPITPDTPLEEISERRRALEREIENDKTNKLSRVDVPKDPIGEKAVTEFMPRHKSSIGKPDPFKQSRNEEGPVIGKARKPNKPIGGG